MMNSNTTQTAAPRLLTVDFQQSTPFTCEIRRVETTAPAVFQFKPLNRAIVIFALACLVLFVSRKANSAIPSAATDLKVLVIAAQTNDFSLGPIREALEFVGTPFDVHLATEIPGALTSDTLRTGTRGHYTGVILTSTSLGYTPDGGETWLSGLTGTEWSTLKQYEIDFSARRLNWYGSPGPDQGLNWSHATVDTLAAPITANWTPAAAAVFPYLNTSNSLPITNVWADLATPLNSNTTVWLNDGQGNALLSSAVLSDGREVATMTFDSANYLVSSTVIRHGLISWVAKGLFLGQRHTYLTAQIDDVFLADDIFTGGEYRQNSNDWHATITWQQGYNQRPSGANFRYDMVFNGQGTLPGFYENDDLTPYAMATEGVFKWISHTFTHPYLTHKTYEEAMPEIMLNNQKAVELGLTEFTPANMVTPNITGLENPSFLNAAYDAGIRYLVTDTSISHHKAPSPNAGIPNWYVPGILMIPRHANNLFYNVSTPTQWELEYNSIFNSFWGRDLAYAEILEDQSDLLLLPLLKGDVSPQMFHQPNVRDFNGQGNTLLGDLLDRVADKYEYFYNFPFLSPTQDKLGETVQSRMDYNTAGVIATLNADSSITLSVSNAAVIPVTGMRTASSELYAGQWITYVDLGAGQSATYKIDANGIYAASAQTNTAPTATAASYTVAAGTGLPITLTGTDPENDELTFVVTSEPAMGEIEVDEFIHANLTYTPLPGMAGTDTFTFTAGDGQFISTGTITVMINDAGGTGTNVTVTLDGSLSEWATIPSAGSGLEVTNLNGNQIDLVELKVTHDNDNVYVAYKNKQPIVLTWGYTLYIDADQNPNTGFAMWEIGADFVIQGNGLYSYSGTGGDWAWSWVQVASATVSGTVAELAFPRSAIGNPDSFHYTFYGNNYAFAGTTFEFVPASAWDNGKSYLRYNLVAPPQELVTVDGDLADWAAFTPLGTDGNEAALTNGPINIRKIYLANDTNKFFLAYENQNPNPITLNWGYTLYLATDATKTTAFNHWNIGADYVIQGNEIFKYAGTGNDWVWTWVGSMDSVIAGNKMEASFAKTLLNNPTGDIRVIFEGDNAAFGGTGVDQAPNNLNGNSSQPGYLTYQVQ
ncbi:MAG: hypothetical protein ACI9OD_004587 [Limisphaerales bacterium]|jgi:hypothetical protein